MHSGKHSQSFKYAYIQNNLAHYNQMLATRAVVDSRRKKERDLSNNHKHDKQVDSERRTLNNILLTKLIDIRDKPQSIMKLTMMAEMVEPKRRCSLKNDFREK